MLTMIFGILMIYAFVKMVGIAVKMSWGIIKILCNLVFLPLVLIGMVVKGLVYLAIPILLVAGVVIFASSK